MPETLILQGILALIFYPTVEDGIIAYCTYSIKSFLYKIFSLLPNAKIAFYNLLKENLTTFPSLGFSTSITSDN